MRRALVLLPAIVLTVAIGVAGSTAQAASKSANSALIVCPVPAGGALVPPCCGPPIVAPGVSSVAECCPLPASVDVQPACCLTSSPCSVTISASPDPADSGQQVTVSGSVLGGAPAGMTVQLWQKVAGVASFSKAGSATVGSDATYSLSAPGTVRTNRSWYVTTGTLRSATLSEKVSANVTLLVRGGHRSATIHGAVAPSHAGETVLIQRKLRGKWGTIAHAALSRHSRFSVRFRGTPRIKATLRAVLPADSKNMRSVSGVVSALVPRRVHAV